MKIPFHTVLGPSLKHNYYLFNSFCSHPLLRLSDVYILVLGIIGVTLSLLDVLMILKCGPTLPAFLVKVRGDFANMVRPVLERDCKLIALLLSMEHYFLLIIGVCTKHPVFFLPFLLLYAFIMVLELITLVFSLFLGDLNLTKARVFTTVLLVYNWMSVFCCFWHKMEYCDY